jgi:adenylate kinase
VAPLVAILLGLPCVSINDVAGPPIMGDEIDTKALRARLNATVRASSLLYGHLLPYVVDKKSVSKVVVLRCEPAALKKRLAARRYPPPKVASNVEAELIGVVSFDAFSKFGPERVAEVDTTQTTPEEAADSTARFLIGQMALQRRIDWSLAYDSAARLASLLDMTPGRRPRT